MTSDFPVPEALRSFGTPLQVCPPKAGAGRTGYFIIAGVFVFLSCLTLIGVVNPPANNPPPPEVLIVLLGVFGFGAMVFVGLGIYAPPSCTLVLFPDGLALLTSNCGGGRQHAVEQGLLHPLAPGSYRPLC